MGAYYLAAKVVVRVVDVVIVVCVGFGVGLQFTGVCIVDPAVLVPGTKPSVFTDTLLLYTIEKITTIKIKTNKTIIIWKFLFKIIFIAPNCINMLAYSIMNR